MYPRAQRPPGRARTLLLASLATALAIGVVGEAFAREREALLIGCSVYPLAKNVPSLPGAENDVARLQSLLVDRLGFERDSVATLAGWPKDEAQRPTKANIELAFQLLTARVDRDSHVFIYLAGHGDQRPIPTSQTDRLDPRNPEPDGLDEVFITADFQNDDAFIRDDQIGRWLDALTAQGAHVWIVFDACHSATLTRGEDANDETTRRLWSSSDVPSPVASADSFALPVESLSRPRAQGSVTAFYACQPFEKAKELYRPRGAVKSDENKRGLFSFHLEEALRAGAGRPITYRDLSRAVGARLRADLGRFAPNPAFDGDLDREVLGFRTWPAPTIRLDAADGRRYARAGTLAGVTREAILAVYAFDDRAFAKELGRVRVVSAALSDAIVEPWPSDAVVPTDGVCRIVERGLDEPKLQVAIAEPPTNASRLGLAAFEESVDRLKHALGDSIEIVEAEGAFVDATLALVSGESSVGASLSTGERVVLTPGAWRASAERLDDAAAIYPANDARALSAALEGDVRKMLVWRRFWRLVEVYDAPASLEAAPLRLDVRRPLASGDRDARPVGAVFPGDVVEASLQNRSVLPHRYAVFYLSSNYAIDHVRTEAIEGRTKLQEFREIPVDKMRVAVKRPVLGPQGYIVIAAPLDQPPLELELLAQSPLGMELRSRGSALAAPGSLLERLFDGAAISKPATRGMTPAHVEPPIVSAASWTVVPRPITLE